MESYLKCSGTGIHFGGRSINSCTWISLQWLSSKFSHLLLLNISRLSCYLSCRNTPTQHNYVTKDGAYLWDIDDAEAARPSKLLGINFSSIGMTGHWLMRPKLACTSCGKLTGLDDFIHTALKNGIHKPEFMLMALEAGGRSSNTGHILDCAMCDTTFTEPASRLSMID